MLLKKDKKLHFKKQIIILLLILVPSVFFAQNAVEGKWTIKNIIGSVGVTEYSLVKENDPNYGRHVTFNLDGTFLCDESMKCLNGCSVSISGTYILIDNNHLQMIVKDTILAGLTCGMQKTTKEDFIKDLGIFYIYNEGKGIIRLIPSNGILQDDKDKMLYNQMTYNFFKEWKNYDYVWQNTNGSNQQEMVNDCIDSKKHINLSKCKVVFSTKRDLEELLILKQNEEFHYVIYDSTNKRVSLAYLKNKS